MCKRYLVKTVLLSLGLCSSVTVLAGSDGVSCETAAYVIDPDPVGLNVRSAPKGKVIAKLPTDAEVTLKAYESGWVKIADAYYMDNPGFADANGHPSVDGVTELNEVNGWVFAKLLGTSARVYDADKTEWLLADHALESDKTVQLPVEAKLQVLACYGKWLEVSYNGQVGWLQPELNCPSALTTCP